MIEKCLICGKPANITGTDVQTLNGVPMPPGRIAFCGECGKDAEKLRKWLGA